MFEMAIAIDQMSCVGPQVIAPIWLDENWPQPISTTNRTLKATAVARSRAVVALIRFGPRINELLPMTSAKADYSAAPFIIVFSSSIQCLLVGTIEKVV